MKYKQTSWCGGRSLFAEVALLLRTASPAQGTGAPREGGACLLGEQKSL